MLVQKSRETKSESNFGPVALLERSTEDRKWPLGRCTCLREEQRLVEKFDRELSTGWAAKSRSQNKETSVRQHKQDGDQSW
jgi:hypothetical protein